MVFDILASLGRGSKGVFLRNGKLRNPLNKGYTVQATSDNECVVTGDGYWGYWTGDEGGLFAPTITFDEKIDLTDYNTVVFDIYKCTCDDVNSWVYIGFNLSHPFTSKNCLYLTKVNDRQYELDVSNLTGEHCLGIDFGVSGYGAKTANNYLLIRNIYGTKRISEDPDNLI